MTCMYCYMPSRRWSHQKCFSTLGRGQWSGGGGRVEKHGLKSLVSCRSQERYNNEGTVPMGRDQASYREEEQREWAAPRSPQLHGGNRALSSHQCD